MKDYEQYEKQSAQSLAYIRQGSVTYATVMLICPLIFLVSWWLLRKKTGLHTPLFILSVLAAFMLLLVGLSTTMIEVDARIGKLEMFLFGDKITFENQVLFFQSKSIIAVVKILLTASQPDAVGVGVLLLCFSVLFPVFKLLSLGIYLLGSSRWTQGRFISYFAFKSGKWSMADVMVIGILMTYIGFNSILESQLAHLHIKNDSLTSITTNNTSLQPGYIVFVGFVVYGLILSEILKKIKKDKMPQGHV